jgi:EAL domain-containing protein (putative c-di-GMP-specific phosphodiesterase class I)/CheY-like chemotaxis protein
MEVPPPGYWKRWGEPTREDAPIAAMAESEPGGDADGGADLPGAGAPAGAGGGKPGGADVEAPFRVLIVEDDRGQALFAQSVLHGAGMQAEVELDPEKVIDTLRSFQPDLVLMDLHMPGRDGMGLTVVIREQPEYLHLPIVFLTGDPDPERQYEVLESGADDFLSKPIRPRHLIAAVANRIQRARKRGPAAATAAVPAATHPETGLATRAHLLQQLDSALEEKAAGGLFFVEIGGSLGLRERYGYASFEQLMLGAARHLGEVAAPHPVTRMNDNSFLVLARGMEEAALRDFARKLQQQLAAHGMSVRGETLHLRSAVGFAHLPQAFAETSAALEAVERSALAARHQADSVAVYVPPAPVEEQARQALAEATLELAFQPIVSVAGGDLAQYQALMRLRQPDGSVLPAAKAVPVAETSGQIVDLDRGVVAQALDLIANSRDKQLRMFVSQSPRTLTRPDAGAWVTEQLAQRGLEGKSLVIDLRLGDALIHTVALRSFCEQLMGAGVQFCLSQFEPGLESEALLSQLPLGYLRVSSRYAGAHSDAQLSAQLTGIIELAHRQGLQVIAQQIEDPQAAAAMWMGGIDFIQGNLVQGVGSELGFDFHNAVL